MSSCKAGLKKSYTLLLGAFFSASVWATPNNSTVAGAIAFEVGQGWVSHYFDEGTQNRWFKFAEIGGHSYCVEAVQGSASSVQLDPNVALYADSAGSATLNLSGVPITSNDAAGDPHFIKGARACYIAQAPDTSTVVRAFKVNVQIAASSGDAGFVKIRVVNTTLQSPCFARVNASFSPPSPPTGAVSNLTSSTISISARMLGTEVVSAPTAAVIAGDRSAGYFSVGVTQTGYYGQQGRCLLAHNGPPGALLGSVSTTDSPTGTVYKYEMNVR